MYHYALTLNTWPVVSLFCLLMAALNLWWFFKLRRERLGRRQDHW